MIASQQPYYQPIQQFYHLETSNLTARPLSNSDICSHCSRIRQIDVEANASSAKDQEVFHSGASSLNGAALSSPQDVFLFSDHVLFPLIGLELRKANANENIFRLPAAQLNDLRDA
ncbi:hypothetical protein NPIL_415051 [Nephila pilipes]|uniref:Uncharacterized protein n=1 Tax=Nephila pilipes TaxID=299642 RepID=A0A8X6JXB2_NEPPI|nr:hypothetical protein NPIL_415051 [Nephila pilipes]